MGCDAGEENFLTAPGPDEAAVDSIAVEPPTARLDQVGTTQPFTATVLDATGDTLTVEVTWSTGDPGVATVNQSGLATATGPGQTDVTASAGDVTGAAVLTVATVVEP